MSVVRTYVLHAKPGNGEALAIILADIADAVRPAEGCQSIVVLRDRADADHFILLENWVSEAAHGAALGSLPTETVQGLVGALDGPLEGSYFEVAKSV
jgi:quinol monooxygenase YgiN